MEGEQPAMIKQMASFEWYRGNLEWLKTNTIFLAAGGSHAYGTNLPTSDMEDCGLTWPKFLI